MASRRNLLEDMTEIISLDCSSITGGNFTLPHQFPYDSSLIKYSLNSLKMFLPSYATEFNRFREQIIQTVYYTINKLMNIIKIKNTHIIKLQQDLEKSQFLTNGMKKQVIQLKDMISEFVQSYSKQISAKDKQIQSRNKQIQSKEKQISQIKNVLKANFNSPSQFCKNCVVPSSCLCREQMQKSFQNIQNVNFNLDNQSFYIQQQNCNKKGQILIQMSESILFSRRTDNLIPLQIIQEQGSDINSLTDYLHSQRLSNTTSQPHNNDNSQSNQLIDFDSRNSLQNKQSQQTHKASTTDLQRHPINIKKSILTQQDNYNFPNKQSQQFLLSHVVNKGIYSSRGTRNEQEEIIKKQRENIQRRCSEQILRSEIIYNYSQSNRNQNNQVKRTDLNSCSNQNASKLKIALNDATYRIIKEQNLSKSSSLSQILHFGDTDQINLPKKFQSPKNMNFVKKNTSRQDEFKEQRLKTEPSPRNLQYRELNKENIHIAGQHLLKGNTQIGRKIFARKKNIKAHCIMNSSANKLQAIMNEPESPVNHRQENIFKASIISNQIPPQNYNYQSTHLSYLLQLPATNVHPINNLMSNSSHANISTINQSFSKSHHEYHSAGKNIPNTPKSIKSMSKSKQKIKVTSKSNKYLVDQFNNLKKGKGSVNLGMKTYMKKTLQQIKNSLKNYQILTNLKQIYYDGKHHNQLKQGKGKIIYENGIIFEGNLKAGVKDGQAKLILNGLQIYQGLYQNDKFKGQGYLKSLRFLSYDQCPKILQDASYFGNFEENRFDGMGTLFLNQRQKIVTKFKVGIPFGQLTYYTQNGIEFGYWPVQ